jgi:ubiquinone/menaquinone biosynthesis C-methylase UbiE
VFGTLGRRGRSRFRNGSERSLLPDRREKSLCRRAIAGLHALAEERITRSSIPVELAGLTGERLDLPSESVDTALSTWTLCTIPHLEAALKEIHRVLKPGGTFHFVEHGHAPDATTARWQRRIEPFNKKIAGGCHLTRRVPEYLDNAGFRIVRLETYYFEGEPKPYGYTFEGQASKS